MSITVSGPQPRSGLAGDSIAIVLTYFLTAAAGMLFWIVAARTIPAHELGVQTALISLITTIGTVTAYGVGSAYKAMLSAPGCVRRQRLVDGLIITVVVSLTVGALAGQFAGEAVAGDSITALLVPAGALVLALFVLKDAALIGLHATRWLPVLNLGSVLVKVGLVLLLAGWLDLPAVWATVIPAAATALFAFVFIIPALVKYPGGVPSQDVPDPRLSRRAMGAFVFRDGVASSTSFGLILVLPFVTTWLAGPVAGATLAIAMAVAQALDFVPDGAGAALTSHMAREPAAATFHVRRIWLISTVLVGTGAVVLAIGSPWVGRLFGDGYDGADFRACLIVVAVGSVLRVPYSIWMSVLRASLETRTILRVNTATFVVSLPTIGYLTHYWGGVGAAVGLAIGSALLGGFGAWDLKRRWLGGSR